MTREEAIEYLDGMKIVIPICNELKELTDERNEAIDMAIEALSADADCSTCKHKDKDWDSEECDSCCGNNNHYTSAEAGWIPCSERLSEKDDLIKGVIDESPTIDAVEVVRCKDCKHRYMDGDVTHYYWCILHDRPVDDADYCAWGEESEDKE